VLNAPRSIPLKWSPALWLATIVVHALPLLACLPAEVPRWMGLVVLAGVSVSAVAVLHSARRAQVSVLRPDSDGALLEIAEHRLRGRVLSASLDLGWLVILHWQPEGGGSRKYFCLLRDGFAVEDWRQLKLWVRWGLVS
jgi:hypothetical protein